mmetsp:Transcript_45566/g.74443  ORF Transcript_45566/g.74443 Transcript_45566/m.74443 type:complete len:142 (+) Transcript_45566:725-1150(+)
MMNKQTDGRTDGRTDNNSSRGWRHRRRQQQRQITSTGNRFTLCNLMTDLLRQKIECHQLIQISQSKKNRHKKYSGWQVWVLGIQVTSHPLRGGMQVGSLASDKRKPCGSLWDVQMGQRAPRASPCRGLHVRSYHPDLGFTA